MTAVARVCSHLASGAQRAYVEDGDARWCLECVADLPELASQPRYNHIVTLVREAREQKQAAVARAHRFESVECGRCGEQVPRASSTEYNDGSFVCEICLCAEIDGDIVAMHGEQAQETSVSAADVARAGSDAVAPPAPEQGIAPSTSPAPPPDEKPLPRLTGRPRVPGAASHRKTKPFADRYAGRGTNAEDEAAIDQVWERYPDKTRAEIAKLLRRLRAEKSA